MEAALHHQGLGSLEGKTVAMQGLGNVSFYMIEELLERRVKKIVGVDIDLVAIQTVGDRFAGQPLVSRLVSPDDVSIFSEACDIFSPNAVGGTLNPQTIPLIQARTVCGGANNQLQSSPRDARLLQEHDVLYVPDFLANRMGIVNCANEQYGVFDGDPSIGEHLSHDTDFGVYRRGLEVFSRAAESGRTPSEEAELLAEELSEVPHPIWGDRGQQIIDNLVRCGWASRETR
jgi:glutamate dehydrogenase/leucine dehydrogenase